MTVYFYIIIKKINNSNTVGFLEWVISKIKTQREYCIETNFGKLYGCDMFVFEIFSLLSMLTMETDYLNHYLCQKSRKIQIVITQFQDLLTFFKLPFLIYINKMNFHEKYTLYSLRKTKKSFLLKLFVLL